MSGPYSIRKFILFPIPPTSPRPLCYTVAMGVNGMDKRRTTGGALRRQAAFTTI